MNQGMKETTSRRRGPEVRQFSIFLQNRVGALLDIVKKLNEASVEVVALSVQDSADSAVTRMVVSDPDLVVEIFEKQDIAYSVSEVLVIELKEASELAKLLTCILMAEVNIDFSYPLMTRPNGRSALIVHVEDTECAASILEMHDFNLLKQDDISR